MPKQLVETLVSHVDYDPGTFPKECYNVTVLLMLLVLLEAFRPFLLCNELNFLARLNKNRKLCSIYFQCFTNLCRVEFSREFPTIRLHSCIRQLFLLLLRSHDELRLSQGQFDIAQVQCTQQCLEELIQPIDSSSLHSQTPVWRNRNRKSKNE